MLRPEIKWFSKQMEEKLKANDHKIHWSKCELRYLLKRVWQETDELWIAIRDDEPATNIVKECADVANFVMMIADNVTNKGENKPK